MSYYNNEEEEIEEENEAEFKSFDDFCARIPPRKVNKRVKENLIFAGAFDNIPIIYKKEENNDSKQNKQTLDAFLS